MAKELNIYNPGMLSAKMQASATANKADKTAEIRAAFEAAINSDIYMSFDEKIKSLLDALSIPISDDQSYNQFYIHSAKDLEVLACRAAVSANIPPVMPTLDQIHAEAKKRYADKADKTQRQADRKAAKAAKNAPAEQPAAT